MIEFLEFISFVITFLSGIIIGMWAINHFTVLPLLKQHSDLIDVLKKVNMDNLRLILKNRNLSGKQSEVNIEFKPMSNEQFEEFMKKVHADDPDLYMSPEEEIKFLRDELSRKNAKGWDENSTLEELRTLYNLL